MLKTIFNIAGLQIGWFACALGAANNLPWAGPIVVTIYLLVHLYLVEDRHQELRLILLVGLIGTLIDGLMRFSGLLIYESAIPTVTWLAPVWITAMWMLFSSTFNSSLSWLKGRPVIAVILGAVFGPLSYIAGVRLEAIAFGQEWLQTVLVLALVWGVAMPLLLHLAASTEGQLQTVQAQEMLPRN